ncbi:hypothetical protein D081_0134 [Anaerovibrio sp. JC8]|nr:hypothetical protein D081_0134 [Anaerovibrio sp. JC8]
MHSTLVRTYILFNYNADVQIFPFQWKNIPYSVSTRPFFISLVIHQLFVIFHLKSPRTRRELSFR